MNPVLIPAIGQAETMEERKYAAVWGLDTTRAILIAVVTIVFTTCTADMFGEPLSFRLSSPLPYVLISNRRRASKSPR